jgi:hypothetical protein
VDSSSRESCIPGVGLQSSMAAVRWSLVIPGLALLASCVTGPTANRYNGPHAPSQVVYRIDENRYFMIEPRLNYACVRADLNYIDTARGIHTLVPGWDRMEKRGRLIIDAANDDFLVAPIAGMDTACAPDAHPAHCKSFLVYSRDAGRTWEITQQLPYREYDGEVRLSGDSVYHAGYRARLPELAAGDSAWSPVAREDKEKLPALRRAPIDTELHCDNSKTIRE